MRRRLLHNTLIPVGGNNVAAAAVVFKDTIEEVLQISNPVDWKVIADAAERDAWFASLDNHNYLNDTEQIDGGGLLLLPGGIDSHVHFNTPGFGHREDFEHASTAAAYGGVTTIIDMPCTSLPPVTSEDAFFYKRNALTGRSLVDYAFWGGINGLDFTDEAALQQQVERLAERGAAGFKIYVISGMQTFTDASYEQIEKAARYVEKTGKPLAVHAEDKMTVLAKREMLMSRNSNSAEDYCAARSVEAEFKAVAEVIQIAERTGCRTLIVHISSERALHAVIEAQGKGIPVFAETCPHYLAFTQEDFRNEKIAAWLKTAPPVKLESDKTALRKAAANGDILFINTDHAGCDPNVEKSSDNFWDIYGGIPGVEHRIPYVISDLVMKGGITLESAEDLLMKNAARFFNLPQKGFLKKGYDADFMLVNIWNEYHIRAADMHSKGKYTPFDGFPVSAAIDSVFLRGKSIMRRCGAPEEEIGYGNFIEAVI